MCLAAQLKQSPERVVELARGMAGQWVGGAGRGRIGEWAGQSGTAVRHGEGGVGSVERVQSVLVGLGGGQGESGAGRVQERLGVTWAGWA